MVGHTLPSTAGPPRHFLRRRPGRPVALSRLYAGSGVEEFGLSPDGRRTSLIDARGRLELRRWADPGAPPERPALPGPVTGHAWLPDSRTLCVTGGFGPAGPDGPDRVLVVPLSGSPPVDVTPVGGDPVLLDRNHPRSRGVLVRTGPAGPDEPAGTSVHLVTADPPGCHRLAGPADVDRWLTDPADAVRAAVRWDLDGRLHVLRVEPDGELVPVLGLEPPDALLTYPTDVTGDGRGLVLHGPLGTPNICVARLDLHTGRLAPLLTEPGRDIDVVGLGPVTRTPSHVLLAGRRPEPRAVDPAMAADVDTLRSAGLGDFRIAARARDDRRWLVRFAADRRPPGWWVHDRDTRRLHPVLQSQPGLLTAPLATVTPVRFTASDGQPLEGYLTRPPGIRGPAPTVLLVHGGPWSSDDWEFDPDVQWLAGRGYACLQVDFRGSERHGARFLDAADGDWGGRMQTDLLDAVDWAVRSGHTDPDRVAIMGGSYGGYAALFAATAGPPRFAAAVAVCAPSDLVELVRPMRSQRSYLHALFLNRLGDPDRDADRLRDRSPLRHAARCHTPLLLVHGGRDGLIPVAHAERMAAALGAAGAQHRLLVFPDEGHGITAPANRIRLARQVERFLVRHPRRIP